MKNLTKLNLLFALLILLSSPIPSRGRVVVDQFVDNGIVDETYIELVNLGQRIHIDITESTGNITIRIGDVNRGLSLKMTFSEDGEYSTEMNRSVYVVFSVMSTPDFKGYLRIYTEGVSPTSYIAIALAVLMSALAFVGELFWRRPSLSPYLYDEEARISFRGIGILSILIYISAIDRAILSSMYVPYLKDTIYREDLYYYNLISTTIFLLLIPLIIFLIVLTKNLQERHGVYSVYPIDPVEQFKARVMVYLITFISFILFIHSLNMINAEYSGLQYVGVYVLAFITVIFVLSPLIFLQILITDTLRTRLSSRYMLPTLMLIYVFISIGKQLFVPLLHILRLPTRSVSSPPFPYLWLVFAEVIFWIAGFVFLDLRKRKSGVFVIN